MMTKVLLTWALLCTLLHSSCAVEDHSVVQHTLSQAPTNLLVTNREVLVSAGSTVQVLNTSLGSTGSISHPSRRSNISQMATAAGELATVICLYDGSCYLHVDYGDLEYDYASQEVQRVAITGAESTLLSISDIVYVASAGWNNRQMNKVILISKFSYADLSVHSSQNEVTDPRYSRNFYGSFHDEEFIYFIAVDSHSSSSNSNSIKVIRLCNNENIAEDNLNSRFEIQIDCGTTIANISSVSLSKIDQTVFLALSDAAAGQSKLCSFNISVVNSQVTHIYQSCLSGNLTFTLPWSTDTVSCDGRLEETSECEFGSPNNIDPSLQLKVLASPTLNIPSITLLEESGQISATAAVKFNEVQYLYVAISGPVSNVIKFHVKASEGSPTLTRLTNHSLHSPVLFMRANSQHVYAATQHEIIRIEVDSCSRYTECSTCVGIGDPNCGWCNLEGKCTSRDSCRYSALRGRWVQENSQCLLSDFKMHIGMDDPPPVSITLDNLFPELNWNESYYCRLSGGRHELVAPVIQVSSGQRSYCNLTDINMTVPRNGTVLSIQSTAGLLNLTLTLYNCSQYRRCSQCEAVPACGWCVYENKCTGSNSLCHYNNTWVTRGKEEPETSCPTFFPANVGHYFLPARVAENMSLDARNIPPPIDNSGYLCKFEYSNGEAVYTSTSYDSSTQVSCSVEEYQVDLSADYGVEELKLSVWFNGSDGELHQIEILPASRNGAFQFDSSSGSGSTLPPFLSAASMMVYDCSHFSESCSLCTGISVENNLQCGWCGVRCTNLQSCSSSDNIHFINSSTRCNGYPNITSITPSSGPTVGGTAVTFTGIDLGVDSGEIEIMFGDVECLIEDRSYVLAQQVECISGPAPPGTVDINIIVRRDTLEIFHYNANFINGTSGQFTYSVPDVESISPHYGPVAGGTHVVVSGRGFNISNPSLFTVTLVEQRCEITAVSDSEINCTTSEFDVVTSTGHLKLEIDNALIDRPLITYMYTKNPHYISLTPRSLIPAGGIAVTVTGHYLNVTQHPRLVIFIGDNQYSNSCMAPNASVLICDAPKLPTPLELRTRIQKRSRDDTALALNFTLVLDRAPGPNITSEQLSLTLKENPVFVEVKEREYILYSGNSLSISGSNLDSVHESEISVTLLGELCVIDSVTPVMLFCFPPDFPILQERDIEIKVSVAGVLQYSVGSVRYLRNGTDDTQTLSQWLPIMILGGVIVVTLMVALICFLGIISIIIIKKRNRVLTVVNENDQVIDGLGNVQDIKSSREIEENLYDIIPEANQNSIIPGANQNGNRNGVHCYNSNHNHRAPMQGHLSSSINLTSSNDEYVRMGSHSLASNTMDSAARKSTDSIAEYVDMQPVNDTVGTRHSSIASDPRYVLESTLTDKA